MDTTARCSTTRTAALLEQLKIRALGDRSNEWFRRSMFPEIGKLYPEKPVIIRRALAFSAMLKAMTNPANSSITGSYIIGDGELIVGITPLGSVGLGKEFPRYMTVEERRLSAVTSRDEESMFGHNSPDFQRVLQKGLREIIEFSRQRIRFLEIDITHRLGSIEGLRKKQHFYDSVIICCDAVIDYAQSFSKLAAKMADEEADPVRKAELSDIAAICNKVPEYPADTFHEALQSIWFIHLALHATLDFVSFGRLDQVIQPFYEKSLSEGLITREKAVELLECFLIKGAGRLNMTSAYLMKQDHLDFGTGLGTSPVFLDQVASANNFLQNVVLGGQTPEGLDATNDSTYFILEASGNVGVPTPTIVVRLHANSPKALLDKAADTLKRGHAGLPIIYNDDSIVKAFENDGIPREDALDYVVDGCWEPILNAKCDWTFGMVNLLTVLECALNGGALLSNNPSLLRGQKKSYATKSFSEMKDFTELLDAVKFHIGFFTDIVGLGIYKFYTIDASVTPTPFFSALLGDCLCKGIDKTWGGADYILGGIISIAAPNCANALMSIKKYVFDEKK
ncbi:MAG: formate acetyltransferase, partial [Chlorobiales bacterium]|nr:formate acetyltransferase [Chlorobiales bacterium]